MRCLMLLTMLFLSGCSSVPMDARTAHDRTGSFSCICERIDAAIKEAVANHDYSIGFTLFPISDIEQLQEFVNIHNRYKHLGYTVKYYNQVGNLLFEIDITEIKIGSTPYMRLSW